MHEIARDLGNRVLRGEVDAVEVVDASVAGVGVEQGLLDGVGFHARWGRG